MASVTIAHCSHSFLYNLDEISHGYKRTLTILVADKLDALCMAFDTDVSFCGLCETEDKMRTELYACGVKIQIKQS